MPVWQVHQAAAGDGCLEVSRVRQGDRRRTADGGRKEDPTF